MLVVDEAGFVKFRDYHVLVTKRQYSLGYRFTCSLNNLQNKLEATTAKLVLSVLTALESCSRPSMTVLNCSAQICMAIFEIKPFVKIHKSVSTAMITDSL